MSKINVIIADDHPIFRIGLSDIIKKSKDLNLLAEAENGLQALEAINTYKPHVALIDIEMPILNGLEVCESVQNNNDNTTKILILTLFKEVDIYKRAMKFGASGYLLKDNAAAELISAVIKVNNGEPFLSNEIEKKLIKSRSTLIVDKSLLEHISKLTTTEKNILLLIAEHKTSKEISSLIFTSEKTVENHRYNIVKKLKLEGTKNNLLMFAIDNRSLLEGL
jgi:DNA-binding NarL/FixJ family response regulator